MLLYRGVQQALILRIGLVTRCATSRGSLRCVPSPRSGLRSSRFISSGTKPYAPKKPLYPERLLIFHAGTGRTVYIGALKVTTLFVFGFFLLLVAPSHYYAPDQPKWISGVVLLSGLFPMIFVAYITAPFVTYVHLRLPLIARQSKDMMLRYVKNLPPNAVLDITTMNFIGIPRVSKVLVSELRPVRTRLGVANFGRDTAEQNSKRPWWMGNAIDRFAIRGGSGRSRESGVWELVEQAIKKGPSAQLAKK